MTFKLSLSDQTAPKLPLSVVVITKNEEQNIARCLSSVKFASEIIVVDSGSSDATQNIAAAYGAQVIEEPWKGFGLQKQSATNKASHDWVLSLDADEEVSHELQDELRAMFRREMKSEAYKIPRLSFHLGRWIRHGGWYPDYQIRLFNRHKAAWTPAALHEKVEAREVGTLTAQIKHYVFKDLAHQIEANNRYSSLGAQEMQKKGKSFYLILLFVRPASKFIETYFWKRGFQDGLAGFIIAIGAAYSMFLRYAKLWESSLPSKVSQNEPHL